MCKFLLIILWLPSKNSTQKTLINQTLWLCGLLTTNSCCSSVSSSTAWAYQITLKQSKQFITLLHLVIYYLSSTEINSHIVFSPSVSDSHASENFAGFVDLITEVGNKTESEDPNTWMKINHHLSAIAFLIGEASKSLYTDF